MEDRRERRTHVGDSARELLEITQLLKITLLLKITFQYDLRAHHHKPCQDFHGFPLRQAIRWNTAASHVSDSAVSNLPKTLMFGVFVKPVLFREPVAVKVFRF